MSKVYCISDLHMGDGSYRDNFAYMGSKSGGPGQREEEFHAFLDYVESSGGRLRILGDLFELWQGNMSKVITLRTELLDRLAALCDGFILGNHDIDLSHFTPSTGIRLTHRLFQDIRRDLRFSSNSLRVYCIHGHLQDKYCCNDSPGLGRISTIYAGLREDLNKSPLSRHKYGASTVEVRSLTRVGRIQAFFKRLLGKPNARMRLMRKIYDTWESGCCDVLIFGHTHEPGQFVKDGEWLPIYNCGTWAGDKNSYVLVEDGNVTVWDWVNGEPVPNQDYLELK